ncbi:hypothetical protein FQN57_002905 [Myotisia sp. PD_48]|nr:hypothetical protein FQN57_002905 [Myotisia sp. PD_48]
MSRSPGTHLIQSILNFGPQRTSNDRQFKSPNLSKPVQTEDSTSTKITGETDDKADDTQESKMEDIISESQSSIPWSVVSSTTADTERRNERRRNLRAIAHETTMLLPNILATAPHAPPKGYLYSYPKPSRLHYQYCPSFPKTAVRVLNADSIDTAVGLAECAKYVTVRDKMPVCVLNMANANNAGGGWKNGAMAQEESLCYRSSLSFTLKLRYYPIPELGAIYSPTVLVIRSSIDDGHSLLRLDDPGKLPVISVVSIAALCEPILKMEDTQVRPGSSQYQKREKFDDPTDRDLTKEKIRVVLRTAAYNGHRRLVLGALGCGAFLNPREEVADCFAEVLAEKEFDGGWWESVIFAIMDDLGEGEDGDGNFGVFYRRLNGIKV